MYFWGRCERKFHHRAKKSAEDEARRLGDGTQAYPCNNCGGWHVGHDNRKNRKRDRHHRRKAKPKGGKYAKHLND